MKNKRNFNPILLARNAIAASGLMTILNVIVNALHFKPIFPLALFFPSQWGWYLFNVPADVETYFGSLEKFLAIRPMVFFISFILITLIAYSYFRSAKKPKAIKIGFVALIIDTIFLLLNVNFGLSWLIEMAYHSLLLYYVFKGVRALKEASNV